MTLSAIKALFGLLLVPHGRALGALVRQLKLPLRESNVLSRSNVYYKCADFPSKSLFVVVGI